MHIIEDGFAFLLLKKKQIKVRFLSLKHEKDSIIQRGISLLQNDIL